MGRTSVAGTAPHRFVRQELLSWVSGSAVRQCVTPARPTEARPTEASESVRVAVASRCARGGGEGGGRREEEEEEEEEDEEERSGGGGRSAPRPMRPSSSWEKRMRSVVARTAASQGVATLPLSSNRRITSVT